MRQQSNSSAESLTDDQAVQTKVEDGQWMLLNEAQAATGLSEKTLRRYIKRGTLKFRKLGKQTNSPFQIWVTSSLKVEEKESTQDVPEFFEFNDEETELFNDQESGAPEASGQEEDEGGEEQPQSSAETNIGIELDRVVRTIAQQFSEKLDQQKEVIFELRQELTEREMQLRLLPDLQKQLEEKEKLADFQTKALEKQVEQLIDANERLREEAEHVKLALEQAEQPWWKKLLSPDK
ncbi:hypothetical protein BH10CYA1_BH10CYA1_62770 [soil metagenome]